MEPIPLNVHDQLGRPMRDLRISVIDTCNFRCPYCMPEGQYPSDYPFLSARDRLSFDEIVKLTEVLMSLGVVKLRLTGGEPLLRRGLPELIERLAAMPGLQDLALTTNAMLLDRHAAELKRAGLHRLTISLDSLEPQTFRALTGGRGDLDRVLRGIEAAEAAGFTRMKFNAVIQRGINEHEVPALVERFHGTGHTLRFIEYMDVGTCNGWQRERVVPTRELLSQIEARWPLRPVDPDYRGEVAQRYRLVDGGGELGFISSISSPFCGDCTRARLSADGRLFKCLFAATGADLRQPLRAGESVDEMRERIRGLWRQRRDRYSELRDEQARARSQRIEMYQIGG